MKPSKLNGYSFAAERHEVAQRWCYRQLKMANDKLKKNI